MGEMRDLLTQSLILVFKMAKQKLKKPFTHLENVVLQTSAVATATMPLAGGIYRLETTTTNNL